MRNDLARHRPASAQSDGGTVDPMPPDKKRLDFTVAPINGP
jgi:hypothetical protein